MSFRLEDLPSLLLGRTQWDSGDRAATLFDSRSKLDLLFTEVRIQREFCTLIIPPREAYRNFCEFGSTQAFFAC